ncbi:MAG TPA: xylose isomerase [Steroidobacteraceae bacterium]|nr:xylose isomerase [Steroidobacteraceae bacterium]
MSIFSSITPIRYEGPETNNDLAYRVYNKDRVVLGKRMEDWLRPAVCYWHSFNWPGNDIFGAGTLPRPWLGPVITQEMANQKLDAAFDFFTRLNVPFFCFHDVDAMATASTLSEHQTNLKKIEEGMAAKMQQTGMKLLWGTANLFSHPRYAGGGATSPSAEVYAWACAQVRFMLETTHRLGGQNYVLWGGREGYDCLLNTDLKRELDQFGRFLSMVVNHKHKIGFKGTILIEPKPFEPTKHQYDRDTATVFAFLQKYGLEKEVKVNIEVNHATLAGLDFEHEVAAAITYGIFGSVDMNRGDPRNGWDTDQFPNNAQELTPAMYYLMNSGGFTTGGFNFDAKLRRQSVDPNDMYIAHVYGLDTLARALLAAADLIEKGRFKSLVEQRYASWQSELGKKIESGSMDLAAICDHAVKANLNPMIPSGKQELFESLVANAASNIK